MRVRAWLVFSLAICGAAPAAAQQDDRVYTWETPPESSVELSLLHVAVLKSRERETAFGKELSRSGLQLSSLELEYGVTDRWTAALYGDALIASDGVLHYSGARAETRYRLFDRYTRVVDTALALEFDAPRPSSGEPQAFAGRLIFSRDLSDLRLLANPIFELPITGDEAGAGVRLGFAGGVYYRRLWRVQPSLEYFATFGRLARPERAGKQRHVLYPGLRVRLVQRLDVLASVGLGLNRTSDRFALRALLTWEFETVPPSQRAR